MLIWQSGLAGTIGGGQMEWMAIDEARRLIAKGGTGRTLSIPLGPAIGQCCGGHVAIALARADAQTLRDLEQAEHLDTARRPHAYIFGAGHVGRALAHALALLPVTTHIVDQRAAELRDLPPGAIAKESALAESDIAAAPAGSAFVIMTHDHALDFLLAEAALRRGDSAYVGLIGSHSKRARFASWYRSQGGGPSDLARLSCPIGQAGRGDKRPEIIAAFAAAEIMAHLLAHRNAAQDGVGGDGRSAGGCAGRGEVDGGRPGETST